ncbi:MAG: ankyrin repeat domain-containing protein, partial [Spirochaetia bacterium]
MDRLLKVFALLSIVLCAATCQEKNADLLIQLAVAGDFESLDKLLEKGADINQRNDDGYNPLYKIVEIGTADTAAQLIERGADVNVKTHRGTLLHTAVLQGG